MNCWRLVQSVRDPLLQSIVRTLVDFASCLVKYFLSVLGSYGSLLPCWLWLPVVCKYYNWSDWHGNPSGRPSSIFSTLHNLAVAHETIHTHYTRIINDEIRNNQQKQMEGGGSNPLYRIALNDFGFQETYKRPPHSSGAVPTSIRNEIRVEESNIFVFSNCFVATFCL